VSESLRESVENSLLGSLIVDVVSESLRESVDNGRSRL
jgi:hypothetical protein